jgi:hypothetical protein
MRTVAKLSAALLACFITTQANAYIYFAHGRMLALDWADDRWILKLEAGPTRWCGSSVPPCWNNASSSTGERDRE